MEAEPELRDALALDRYLLAVDLGADLLAARGLVIRRLAALLGADVGTWGYATEWREAAPNDPREGLEGGWLLMGGAEGLAQRLGRAIDELGERGAECAVLGCTEIPLIVTPENASLPVLDSTRLLARHAVATALSGEPLSIRSGWIGRREAEERGWATT